VYVKKVYENLPDSTWKYIMYIYYSLVTFYRIIKQNTIFECARTSGVWTIQGGPKK